MREVFFGDKKYSYVYRDKKVSVFITIIYSILIIIGLYHHEIWRDESQAWLIATNSLSIFDIFKNTRHEGHPILWHIILFFCNKIYSDIYIMQIIHGFLAIMTVLILNLFSPFSTHIKVLITFSSYFLYEYSIISRNYILGVFLLFVFSALYANNKNKNRILLSVILFLAASVNAYVLCISIALFVYLNINDILTKKHLSY